MNRENLKLGEIYLLDRTSMAEVLEFHSHPEIVKVRTDEGKTTLVRARQLSES